MIDSTKPIDDAIKYLSTENPRRDEYILTIKAANSGNYSDLIEMHKITY
jgi:hypothetical protein